MYSFTGAGDAKNPNSTLVQGRDGRLYGTANGTVAGAVFRVTSSDVFTELYALQPATGSGPYGLVLGTDGNYYGVAAGGGSNNNGVLFKTTPSGTYTVLHSFAGGSDGATPFSPPIQASDGNLYGTTDGDATGSTIYRYTLAGKFNTIYQFAGNVVIAPLLQGSDGNLYGVMSGGGTSGCGGLFDLSVAGTLLQSYSFPCGTGGNAPGGPLTQAADGNFYGTTSQGGTANNGTIFKATPSFHVSILYNFVGGKHDGQNPFSGLIQATDGNLYGNTANGGSANLGTLFQISTTGAYKSLYSFQRATGPQRPITGLMQHTNGLLFGTTGAGGANNLGTVFALDMGFGPFITFVRANGKVGQTAQILGQGFTGTTSVTFNNVAATSFTVGNPAYLRAVIPSGATTGPVVVTTPKGTLTSNVNFVVTQ